MPKKSNTKKIIKKEKVSTEKASKQNNKNLYYYGRGSAKTSQATVRLFKGEGDSLINEKKFEDVYPDFFSKHLILSPMVTTGTHSDHYFTAKSRGGGKISQAKAITMALARAVAKIGDSAKKTLSQNKLLRRDPRMVERKKYFHIKSRKSPQYSKR
jgi:small subunit ribosomal protein S9